MAVEFDGAIDSGKNKGSVTLGDFGTSSRIAAAVRMQRSGRRAKSRPCSQLHEADALPRVHPKSRYTTGTWLS
jgi:hypothetical protein